MGIDMKLSQSYASPLPSIKSVKYVATSFAERFDGRPNKANGRAMIIAIKVIGAININPIAFLRIEFSESMSARRMTNSTFCF